MIANAAKGESRMFQNFYITIDGEERDALKGGALSCGTFLSSVLYLQNSTLEFLKKPRWISFVHANIPATEKDMRENGWYEIQEPREGAVLIWEAREGTDIPVYGNMHLHAGFSIGNNRAVSNGSNTTLMPEEHHITYEGTRTIIRIWWHAELEN